MRKYVEAIELLPPESTEEPDFIRVDVTDLSEAEVREAVDYVKQLMAGTSYCIYIHYCHHDEDPKKPCSIVLIEEVAP